MNTTMLVDEESKLGTVDAMINGSYNRDIENSELKEFKELVKTTRKFGFPIVCTITSETEQRIWAAKLLISISGTWPIDDIPEEFKILKGSSLYNDVEQLLANSVGNFQQFSLQKT